MQNIAILTQKCVLLSEYGFSSIEDGWTLCATIVRPDIKLPSINAVVSNRLLYNFYLKKTDMALNR